MDRVERTALVSVAINAGLVILKVSLAALSGSLALLADAWHSGSDIVASGLVWAGARISRGERRERLAVAENVVALVIGALILWAAVGIFRRVSTAAAGSVENLPLAIGGSLIAALVSYYAAQYKLHVGRGKHGQGYRRFDARSVEPLDPHPVFWNLSEAPLTSTFTLSPSENSPDRIRLASGFSMYCWIRRLSGRAPYTGS